MELRERLIRDYDDFVATLLEVGFSMGGGNSEGIYSVVPWSWNQAPPYDTLVCWHTGDPETDPWEWRMRVLDERDDIAYAKMFFKKSGYITKDWYSYFLAVRRGGTLFEEEYRDGKISGQAKRIYDVVSEYGTLPLHAIKELASFGKDQKSSFERALVELQMKMYLTVCGKQQKISRKGDEYGWSSTVFCTVESFFGEDFLANSAQIDKEVAIEKITDQVHKFNPQAEQKKILKFIKG